VYCDVDRATYHGHVCLHPTQWARLCYRGQVLAECRRVERVAEGEKRRQALERRVGEAIEIGKVARLVYFVDIGLFGCEVDMLANFFADITKEGIVD